MDKRPFLVEKWLKEKIRAKKVKEMVYLRKQKMRPLKRITYLLYLINRVYL
ncbi:hypothetical protein [Cytobacillus sp. FSL R7-0680]|uniref:hypothetical protein n=1 Tax=Cytobacillus sp. FSL R7-0680 TaxID=2921689 RepID=UPI0030FC6F0B